MGQQRGSDLLQDDILKDLERSGLHEVVKTLGIRTLPSELGAERYGVRRTGYILPYFDLDGSFCSDEFFRIRWLSAADTPDAGKYYQLPGTLPRFYLPPFLSWKKIAADAQIPIWITEGEKKSAA